ncbi:MAG: hypothetical protein C7B47_16735 [Sulfobacillus thermosulfidooxidans]|uniref:HNH endonuclease n=1 Tax=Sulfobacillus thermosulfidooxidans TaxID=28034 RepID=A0A2T2WJE8_SULTH|nr:MAG: hypothetical protein C7B47_16735 [Sulfobacillus thermosulfidooxidans]
MGLECWVCGHQENLQTHHWFERSLWEELDPTKIPAVLQVLDVYRLSAKDDSSIEIPNDIRNLMCLCEVHHIGQYTGIHAVTFPILQAELAKKDGQEIIPPLQNIGRRFVVEHLEAFKKTSRQVRGTNTQDTITRHRKRLKNYANGVTNQRIHSE